MNSKEQPPKDAEQEIEVLNAEQPQVDSMQGLEPAIEIDEAAKWKDLALRAAADFDNFRKRITREREDSSRYATQDLLEQLLPILDNFEMGMQAAASEQSSMIYIGMDMVRKQLADFLANQGVVETSAQGALFDPNQHEAVSEEVSTEVPEGHVLRVLRRGFTLRDRLIRSATVIVSKSAE
jgi:molecular chaperone GrpE